MRTAFAAVLIAFALNAHASAGGCHIAGTAYDDSGKTFPASVVRLTDAQTHQSVYSVADANARFEFDNLSPDDSGHRYRLDMLSPATVVTGTHLRTRSVVGIAPAFACSGNQRVDVKAEVH
jgi:hypothetical protein